MHAMKFSVSAIAVHTTASKLANAQASAINLCRYVLPDGSYFQYNRDKGMVSQVIRAN